MQFSNVESVKAKKYLYICSCNFPYVQFFLSRFYVTFHSTLLFLRTNIKWGCDDTFPSWTDTARFFESSSWNLKYIILGPSAVGFTTESTARGSVEKTSGKIENPLTNTGLVIPNLLFRYVLREWEHEQRANFFRTMTTGMTTNRSVKSLSLIFFSFSFFPFFKVKLRITQYSLRL